MSQHKMPLNSDANNNTIQDLYSLGYLEAEIRKQAVKLLCPPKIMWQIWADRMLLLFSTALVLAGIVFFFAYNWDKMADWLKLGLLQLAIIGCITFTIIKGVQQITGKLSLLAASLFVGVLLAVYGQIYQTGADSYQFFLAWSLLITGWVIVSKFGGLWLMWLLLINSTIVLYFDQILTSERNFLVTILPIVNMSFLSAREYAVSKGVSWLSSKWLRWVVLGTTLFFLTCYVMSQIVDSFKNGTESILPLVVLVGINLAAGYFYRYRSPDLSSLTIIALSGCAIVLTVIGKFLFKIDDNPLIMLFFGVIILAVVSVAAFLLRNIGKSIDQEAGAYGN